jgi:thiamine pyrophosphate-dependent acetolactate synthase large subunit-like protein
MMSGPSHPTQYIHTQNKNDNRFNNFWQIMEAFGGRGYFVSTPDELKHVLSEWRSSKEFIPTLINVMIDPRGPTPANVAQQQAKEHRIASN